MFCHNCGNKLPDGSKFCDNCGTKLGNAGAAPVEPQPQVRVNPFAEPGESVNAYGEVQYSSCDSNVAALLSFLFGALGLHDFYCGKTSNGIIKLVLTITGIATIVSVIWNLIDLYSIGDGSYMDGSGNYLAPAPWAKVIVILGIVLSIGMMIGVVALLMSVLG